LNPATIGRPPSRNRHRSHQRQRPSATIASVQAGPLRPAGGARSADGSVVGGGAEACRSAGGVAAASLAAEVDGARR
jgi:hypothetical protein